MLSNRSNFWNIFKDQETDANSFVPRTFFALAPMADVTDPAFRQIIAKYGKPDVMWTEFVSADGLVLGGREHLLPSLMFTQAERPIVAQLFGSNPETMRQASKLVAELGFDGIDINMGCPDRTIEKQGAGAMMMKNPELAVRIIRSAKAGIIDAGSEIPLSVKTRIGYYKNEIETWLPVLLAENLSAITVHCRTRKELSKVPARWEHLKEVVALRDKISPETLIIGNGDVSDLTHGRELAKESGVDGVMIGRAVLGNPWLFAELTKKENQENQENQEKNCLKNQSDTNEKKIKKKSNKYFREKYLPEYWAKILQKFGFKNRYWLRGPEKKDKTEKLRVLAEHCKLFEELIGPQTPAGKNFAVMKKHFKAYVYGWPGAKDLRAKLMEAKNADEVEATLRANLR